MDSLSTKNINLLIAFTSLLISCSSYGMGLTVERSTALCGLEKPTEITPPAQTKNRLLNSKVAHGKKDIHWAWLGSPTVRYPHNALGAITHAGSLHVLTTTLSGKVQEVVFELPINRVFEDRVPRIVDLDGDGKDEIILIESEALGGSATVVYGLQAPKDIKNIPTLVVRARSPVTGSTFRWLNPVGVADFDGDGKLDIASVITPHIGGTLTLYHYAPPNLESFAQTMDTSNHRMGDLEQQLAVIVERKGERPTIIVPDMQLKSLHALRWEVNGKWKELADVMPLPATVKRMTPLSNGSCMQLTDKTWWRVYLVNLVN